MKFIMFKKEKHKKHRRQIDLDPDVLSEINELAEREKRTAKAQIELILTSVARGGSYSVP